MCPYLAHWSQKSPGLAAGSHPGPVLTVGSEGVGHRLSAGTLEVWRPGAGT